MIVDTRGLHPDWLYVQIKHRRTIRTYGHLALVFIHHLIQPRIFGNLGGHQLRVKR